MSDTKTIPMNADALRAQLRADHQQLEAVHMERMENYVLAYERLHRVLDKRDYPDEVQMATAAALAAAWVKSLGD